MHLRALKVFSHSYLNAMFVSMSDSMDGLGGQLKGMDVFGLSLEEHAL